MGNPGFIDQAKSMYAKSFHHTITTWYGPVAHQPHDHMRAFRHQGNKIPECIVCRCGLWHFMVGFGLHGVYKVRELHSILDKENGHVIAHQVKVAFFSIKLYGKPPYVTGQVSRATGSCYC